MIALDHDRCTIVQGEALASMRALLADRSVDLVLTDPPYGAHTHKNLGRERRNDGHAVRDELQFPPLSPEFIAQLAAEFTRVCRGWILIFTDNRTIDSWGLALERAGSQWVRVGEWVKTAPMPQMSLNRPAAGVEHVVIAHAPRDGRMVWNGGAHAAVWRGNRNRDAVHPNQKPLWLVQALLGSFAPPGALVLDPFLGSGTTIAAALAGGRVAGESALETCCSKCAAKRAEEWAPPLPQGARVLGIEGNPRWVAHASTRILSMLGTL